MQLYGFLHISLWKWWLLFVLEHMFAILLHQQCYYAVYLFFSPSLTVYWLYFQDAIIVDQRVRILPLENGSVPVILGGSEKKQNEASVFILFLIVVKEKLFINYGRTKSFLHRYLKRDKILFSYIYIITHWSILWFVKSFSNLFAYGSLLFICQKWYLSSLSKEKRPKNKEEEYMFRYFRYWFSQSRPESRQRAFCDITLTKDIIFDSFILRNHIFDAIKNSLCYSNALLWTFLVILLFSVSSLFSQNIQYLEAFSY